MKHIPQLDGKREEILIKFYHEFIIPRFLKHGYTLPQNVRISIGLQPSKNAIGSTFHPAIGGGYYHIYIAPRIVWNIYEVAATLIHEAIHTLFFDHKAGFSTCAAAVGLKKPWTATTANDALDADVTQWLADNDINWFEPSLQYGAGADLGDGVTITPGSGFRHSPTPTPIGSPKKQPSRMVKLSCPDCGYIIRTAKNNITTKGLPVCPCGTEFKEN